MFMSSSACLFLRMSGVLPVGLGRAQTITSANQESSLWESMRSEGSLHCSP